MADAVISGPVGDDGTRPPFSVDDVPWEETVQGAPEAEGTLFREPTKPLRWCREPAT